MRRSGRVDELELDGPEQLIVEQSDPAAEDHGCEVDVDLVE